MLYWWRHTRYRYRYWDRWRPIVLGIGYASWYRSNPKPDTSHVNASRMTRLISTGGLIPTAIRKSRQCLTYVHYRHTSVTCVYQLSVTVSIHQWNNSSKQQTLHLCASNTQTHSFTDGQLSAAPTWDRTNNWRHQIRHHPGKILLLVLIKTSHTQHMHQIQTHKWSSPKLSHTVSPACANNNNLNYWHNGQCRSNTVKVIKTNERQSKLIWLSHVSKRFRLFNLL